MKLFAKKEQRSEKKVQSLESARKATVKPVTAKPLRPRKVEPAKKILKKPAEARMAWVESVRSYLREVTVELKKVVWPSRKETLGSTAVVLVIVGLAAVFLGIVDLVLSRLVKLLVG